MLPVSLQVHVTNVLLLWFFSEGLILFILLYPLEWNRRQVISFHIACLSSLFIISSLSSPGKHNLPWHSQAFHHFFLHLFSITMFLVLCIPTWYTSQMLVIENIINFSPIEEYKKKSRKQKESWTQENTRKCMLCFVAIASDYIHIFFTTLHF